MSDLPHIQVWIHPDGTWSSLRRDGSHNFVKLRLATPETRAQHEAAYAHAQTLSREDLLIQWRNAYDAVQVLIECVADERFRRYSQSSDLVDPKRVAAFDQWIHGNMDEGQMAVNLSRKVDDESS